MLNPIKTPTLLHLKTLQSLLGPHHFPKSQPIPNLFTHLSHSSSPNLVSKICHILTDPKWEKSSELLGLVQNLRAYHIVKIINTHTNTDSALRFFFWVSRRKPYKHDMSCFVSMVDRLVAERRFGPADHVRLLLVKGCRNVEELKWVIGYLNEKKRNGFGFTLYSFNTLLIQLASHKYDEVDQLVELMKERGMHPSEEFYRPLFCAHCKNLKLDSALELFGLMAGRGHKVDLSVYTDLVCALCRENRMEEAQTLLKNLLECQWNADEIVWTVLIDGLLKQRLSDPCMQLLHVIESQNCILWTETYAIFARELSHVKGTR